jgi:mRNA interferase MazF
VAALPSRGEIWLADLNPTRDHEQAGRRPVLIISADAYNRGPSGLVFVLPLTRTNRRIPIHVEVRPSEGGLRETSYILTDAIRSISRGRLSGSAWGRVSSDTMRRVEDALRVLMEL